MYHEEQIINGRLCWRGTPDGKFIEYTLEQMAIKYEFLCNELRNVKAAA